MQVDTLIEHCRLATMTSGADDGCAVWSMARLRSVTAGSPGSARAATRPGVEPARGSMAAGGWLTPGLIDCHTHLVYGGNRAGEFELRLQGASYEEIARAGGGIVSTVARPARPATAALDGRGARLPR